MSLVPATAGAEATVQRREIRPAGVPQRSEDLATPAISVVICAYADERWPDLVAAVKSAENQSLPPAEVIVVIDHNPALLARVRRHLPEVRAVNNEEQRGLSGARNSGIRQARAGIVAFLDDDATAAPDWLERLSAAYRDPSVLGVGGAIEPRWANSRPAWFPEEFDWVIGCTYRGLPRRRAPVRNLIGANMSFLRQLFDEVGGFQTGIGRVGKLPMGCEETELCIRAGLRRADGVFLFEPQARVYHRVPAARANWRYFGRRAYSEGLSKALIGRHVGASKGLASEWRYTLLTLPLAVLRHLSAALIRGDVAGIGRAAAIIAGLTITTFGYVVGKLPLAAGRMKRTQASPY